MQSDLRGVINEKLVKTNFYLECFFFFYILENKKRLHSMCYDFLSGGYNENTFSIIHTCFIGDPDDGLCWYVTGVSHCECQRYLPLEAEMRQREK